MEDNKQVSEVLLTRPQDPLVLHDTLCHLKKQPKEQKKQQDFCPVQRSEAAPGNTDPHVASAESLPRALSELQPRSQK